MRKRNAFRISKNESVKVHIYDNEGKYKSSVFDSFDSVGQVLNYAKYIAEKEHFEIGSICITKDGEGCAEYLPCGKRIL